MKWPQRWVATFVVTLPARKGKNQTKLTGMRVWYGGQRPFQRSESTAAFEWCCPACAALCSFTFTNKTSVTQIQHL